jgi:cytochrome c-type biogenesis protein CcmH
MIDRLQRARYIAPLLLIFVFFVGTVQAQRVVTQDEVNEVAGRMYCPVCENIPLDDCGTLTCQAWKEEIRQQLIAGESEQAIVDDFVARYGEQVVGIPQNPILRALSLITPWVLVACALMIGVWTFRRWQKPAPEDQPSTLPSVNTEAYRSRIEQDVN